VEGSQGVVDAGEVAEALRPVYRGLRRFAAVVGPLEMEPDDLVQEAVVRLLASGRWSTVDDLGAYLRRTIVNLAANERRRLGRHRAAVDRDSTTFLELPTYPSDVSDLDRVEPLARGLLYLVDVEGVSITEAADIVGCSPVAARARLSRARKMLRVDLETEALS
jgi:DNA-directed RNA polymerase specialized sigma24 family protein